MLSKRSIGITGEERAVAALKKIGYKIVERNYRSRYGEIDIIAEEQEYLVFVEVKRRNSGQFGASFQAVNTTKQKHMIRTAEYYLKTHKFLDRKVRFDVVGIDGDELKIVRHAFLVKEGF